MATASPPRSNIQQENLKVQAENLLSGDATYLIGLLANLYAPGEPFESLRSEANSLLDVALEHYADGITFALSLQLQENADETNRLRLAMLLERLFIPQNNFYDRLSDSFQTDLKLILFQRIENETDQDVLRAVLPVISNVAEVVLPKNEWPELYNFIFESLISNVSKKKSHAIFILADLIPKCPGVFLFHIDVLCDAFKGFMDRTWEDPLLGTAAVKAAVALVLHLSTPFNHEKYYDLLLHMGRALLQSLNVFNGSVTHYILEDMTVLAQKGTMFLGPHIGFLVKTMLDVTETDLQVVDQVRISALEFVFIVAEDVDYGCGMIQNIPPELLKRLFTVLFRLLSAIDEDPLWEQYDSGSDCENEPSESSHSLSYAMEAIPRLVSALRENVIMQSLPDCFPEYLENSVWQWRHAGITGLGLIADGCPKACSGISRTLMGIILRLFSDDHPRVCWATIQAIGQLSKNWGPRYQRDLYSFFLPGLISYMEKLSDPKLQLAAISSILLFSKNCGSEIFSPHLGRILKNLCTFLQIGLFREEVLPALASLADTFPKEFEEYYDTVLGHVKVCLVMKQEKMHSMVPAKALECMTMIAVAAGKNRFKNNVDKVVDMLINFQESRLESDDPMRHYVLRAWGRLARCLGTDFTPYFNVCMPQLFDAACLPNFLNPDDQSVRSNVVEEKAAACEVLCTFATELTTEIHMWIDGMLFSLVPLLKFHYDARIRTHAISAMPLIFRSASSAENKLLPTRKTVKDLSYRIVPALIDALSKEWGFQLKLKFLEALNKSIEIAGSYLTKNIINDFIKVIAKLLSAFSNNKTERKRRVERRLDLREKKLLQEEIDIDNKIYRAIGDCLISIFKIFGASFLPMFDKLLLPCLVTHWNTSSTERRIFLNVVRVGAEKCGEKAFKFYEEQLFSMLNSCDLADPSVWQLVGYGISICAEFGGNVFRPYCEAALTTLQCMLTNPIGLEAHNLVNREIAVFALGKMCKFQFHGPEAHRGVRMWLSYLPLKNNMAEAQEIHDDLCTMFEKSENKVLGPRPGYNDYRIIIGIFAQILSNEILATEDTMNRMKEILRKIKERMLSCDFEFICSVFPLPIQSTLNYCLESV